MTVFYQIIQPVIKGVIRIVTDPESLSDSVPNNTIILRDGSYLIDRQGNYITTRV